MNYQEAIDWLYSTQQFGIKLGLEPTKRLLRETLSYQRPGTTVVHVAGTNGKGSTCSMLDALARGCGVRTGLFTSPHLVSYTERIRVSGAEIPEETVAGILTDLKELVKDWEHHPTFFELTLALAMRYFREQRCELIILETGMGGRLDATTAVPADVAVITPIAMDHAQWLGDDLTKIAHEKAGIIVPNKPVFSSKQEPAAHTVIEQTANERICPIEFITEPLTGYSINLPGEHQQFNAALAISVGHHIRLPLNSDIVRQALEKVQWPGRFESLPNTNIILDAAHNPHAATALVNTWNENFPDQKAQLIFGAVEGKSHEQTLRILAPIAEHIHLVPTNSPRGLDPSILAESLPKDAPLHSTYQDVQEALEQTSSSPQTLIAGSIFLIGHVKGIMENTQTRSSSQ